VASQRIPYAERRALLGRAHTFPKDESFGRPSFKTVLRDIAQRFRESPEMVQPNVRQISDSLDQAWYQNRAGTFRHAQARSRRDRNAQNCDIFLWRHCRRAEISPMFPVLELLWRAYLRTGMQQFLSLTLVTLDNMGRGGIYDHIGGGFARYAVDEQWMLPHFEKMLYDNAPDDRLDDLDLPAWKTARAEVEGGRDGRLGVARNAHRERRFRFQFGRGFRRRRGQVLYLDGK
jgi:hypothetical protein